MPLSTKSLAGPGYIILNVIRGMNIVGLLAVTTASIVMLVKTFIVSKFFFFDACSHVITALISLFLVASETPLFRTYFDRCWPLLSPKHGFVTLGFGMIVLGINILGNLNKEATSAESLGLPMWRIVIASGIVILVLGFVNMVISYVFRDPNLGLTARMVRHKGAVAVSDAENQQFDIAEKALSNQSSIASMSIHQQPFQPPYTPADRSPHRFNPTSAWHRARDSILPSYRSLHSNQSPMKSTKTTHSDYRPQVSRQSSTRSQVDNRPGLSRESSRKSHRSHRSRDSVGPRIPINVSSPSDTSNSQFAQLQRPDPARHPSERKGGNPYELGSDFWSEAGTDAGR
ncbi:uncharacterized protein K452DRAFT_297707 [Aplosporella prunicola CBS 121167]|uniref:DUF7598 domain-containing protein n=1 Tax=Aplosporella prunicola CBS 121167 TaxID=1176127 RepID=A0A6A6BGH3_9PEZI|nr:uncharacterized protein K452DRAFT_297707 [Aplosporella prunicola CBS 121167]KAF2142415.1 hypothetical protein K452DRAFT_297707 [Aplosporella prunicola CBS 121167]